jgi:hypothetical protein
MALYSNINYRNDTEDFVMNLPVNSTRSYLRHIFGLKRVKVDAFFLSIRDNILNHRDQREAWKNGTTFTPTHHEAKDLLNKRVVAENDRYSYGRLAHHQHNDFN